MTASDRFGIQGHVSPGFETVREAFAENSVRATRVGWSLLRLSPRRQGRRLDSEQADRRALGARHDGHHLFSYQGSRRDDSLHRPLSRMARLRRAGLHLLAPEFAQYGKERITVRQLLAHQAGLYALDESIDRDLVVTSIGWQWC